MSYPSTLSSFTNPLATDRLNSPSHSAIETAQNTALEEIQAYIGVNTGDTASVIGTLLYDIKAPGSNGGGHIQAPVTGGTGQTTYSKGDILVAQSPSVLTKLSITPVDGLTLVSDSSQNTGIKWGSASASKVVISATSVVAGFGSVSETSLMSATIPGSTLGTNNALRATLFVREFTTGGGSSSSVLVKANYGATNIGSVLLVGDGSGALCRGKIECIVLANQSTSTQLTNTLVDLKRNRLDMSPSVVGVNSFTNGVGAVDSSASQTLGITARFSTNDVSNNFTINGYVIEKIV